MNWEYWYYVFGTLFFVFAFILLIVLIIGALLILKNLNRMQAAIEEAMDKNQSLTKAIPLVLMAGLEARGVMRRFRGRGDW